MTYEEKYKEPLEYIDAFWTKVTIRPKRRERLLNVILKKSTKRMHENILNLPKPFIIPNATNLSEKRSAESPGWFAHIFYWDTFFMFKGLIRTRHEKITKSMVDNFIFLYKRYGIIPNFNSPASTGRSQPPFLTSMILDAYNRYYLGYKKKNPFKRFVQDLTPYKEWLQNASEVAKREYFKVWIDEGGFYHHRVNGYSLSKYGDRDIGYAHSAELESGWDFTSRFYNRCNEFLPIDLNCLLYKYERDFVKIAKINGDRDEEKFWQEAAEKRRAEINKFLWNEKMGFFYDYGYAYKKQSDFLSLAGFVPLWTGLASPTQSKKMVKMLKYFETDHGLTITAKESLAPSMDLKNIPERFRPAIVDILKPKQWDYPNIWPPLEYLTVIGLLKYGFVEDAKRIMKKSLATQAKIFDKYKTFFEKIDGVKGDIAGDYHYKTQNGFGWTNAVFYRYVQILDAIESGVDLYTKNKEAEPPYKLSIPH